jgi:uncharacterized membrane protein
MTSKSSLTKRRAFVENEIRLEIEEELENVKEIKKSLSALRVKLLEKRPEPFSTIDILYAFFASLVIGLGFAFKGSLISFAVNLTSFHINFIILTTILFLTAEAYFLGYRRVSNKNERKIGQFLFKRVATLLILSLLVSLFLVYTFGINYQPLIDNNIINIFKVVVALTMPCATGAAIPSLLKKY